LTFPISLSSLYVRYADNVKNSKEICRKILAEAKLEFTEEYERRVDEYLKKSSEERKKLKESSKKKEVHAYSLEDYGLTEDIIREEFREYIEKYKLQDK